MGNEFAPAGAVQYFARDTAPEGWLVADGREVSRNQYPDLFKAIRVKFGMGDGVDTFNLPDLRGEFIRGFDGGRGVDAGRQFGSRQQDAFKNHTHNVHNGIGWGGGGSGPGYGRADGNSPANWWGAWADGTGDVETRPRNIALLACIKY